MKLLINIGLLALGVMVTIGYYRTTAIIEDYRTCKSEQRALDRINNLQSEIHSRRNK